MQIDYFLFQKINSWAGECGFLDIIGIFFAEYFQYLVVIGLLVFWFLGRSEEEKKNNRTMVALGIVSAFVARYIVTDLIRFFYFRPRPFLSHQVIQLINHEATGSLPSGHSAFFFALAMIIYFYHPKISSWFFASAFLIGLARIFSGVHYPIDILAGALIGVLTGMFIRTAYKRFFKDN